ncbi:hypothetical protein [Streptomyces cellostaticus]|uniref:hypothetical protein n=1 Tax=Streptomyces cellostaticus TaxID=67285 RepID=UPI0020271E06|nr:hypothetical protein [Streptomyces cellostaticus]
MFSHVLPADSPVGAALAAAADRTMAFLDYFAGVFTLLSLTAAVVCGLAATDRLVLTRRLRVAVQALHRATAVAALGFLTVHVAVKVAERHAAPQSAVVPFTGGTLLAVSLGTVAADLLVLVAATGVLRGRFAGSRRPWLWRVLHSLAYACWPIAVAHGVTAGRRAHAWVLWGYGLCAAGVALVLMVRGLSHLGRRRALKRCRRGSRAYRPATAHPAALAALSARAPRPGAAARPVGAAARPMTPTEPGRRSVPHAGPARQPRHAPPPELRPLRLAQPRSGR